eukprot:jgi/Mesvir1/24032/Mv10770-RA.2
MCQLPTCCGSPVTLGFKCESPSAGKVPKELVRMPHPCAWPARLVDWLHRVYPDTPEEAIELVNLGQWATTSEWAAAQLLPLAQIRGDRLEEVDLFIVDYEINDEQSSRVRPAEMHARTESLLLQLLTLPQKPAVVYFFTGTQQSNSMAMAFDAKDEAYFQARPWLEDEEMRVLRYYDVPALSWRDAFWHVAFSPDGERHPFLECHNLDHPGGCLHCLWAAVAANMFRVEMQALCSEAAWGEDTISAAQGEPGNASLLTSSDDLPAKLFQHLVKPASITTFLALHQNKTSSPPRSSAGEPAGGSIMAARDFSPLTMLSVNLGEAAFTPVETTPPGQWQFREDVPGKPGWIVEGPGGGEEISFDVMMRRRLVVGFMSSYENMGRVEVYVDKLIEAHGQNDSSPKLLELSRRADMPATVLDSLWQARSSQYSQKTVVDVPPKAQPIPVRVRLRRIEPTRHEKTARGLNKFKLLAILSY